MSHDDELSHGPEVVAPGKSFVRATTLLTGCLLYLAACGAPVFGGGSVSVRGHTRKDGTYVRPYTRSKPGSKSTAVDRPASPVGVRYRYIPTPNPPVPEPDGALPSAPALQMPQRVPGTATLTGQTDPRVEAELWRVLSSLPPEAVKGLLEMERSLVQSGARLENLVKQPGLTTAKFAPEFKTGLIDPLQPALDVLEKCAVGAATEQSKAVATKLRTSLERLMNSRRALGLALEMGDQHQVELTSKEADIAAGEVILIERVLGQHLAGLDGQTGNVTPASAATGTGVDSKPIFSK